MNVSKKSADVARLVVELFIERIDADVRFYNERMKEWCSKMQVPHPSYEGSVDRSAIDQVASLSSRLASFNAVNSTKGAIWPSVFVEQYLQECEVLGGLIRNSDIHESVENLYYHHKGIGYAAGGMYEEALVSMRRANEILKNCVKSSSVRLPRYRRNIIMNDGLISEFYRRCGDVCASAKIAEIMFKSACGYLEDKECMEFDKSPGFCPILSWSLYFCCEAHLAVKDWDVQQAKDKRDWWFAETFSKGHHENWNIPTLIQILRDATWRERYQYYYERIADLVFVGAAPDYFTRMCREFSVLAGRIRLKPNSAAAAVVLLAFITFSCVIYQKGEPADFRQNNLIHVFDKGVEDIRANGVGFEEEDVEEARREIVENATRLVNLGRKNLTAGSEEGGEHWISGLSATLQQGDENEDGLPRMLTAGVGSHEQGAGLGVKVA